jgi:magnesium chelatase family protein
MRNSLKISIDNGSSNTIRIRVLSGQDFQAARFKRKSIVNGDMSNKQIKKFSLLSSSSIALLNTASEKLNISARNYMRTIKVARTIAGLEKSPTIEVRHISEALQYRKKVLRCNFN